MPADGSLFGRVRGPIVVDLFAGGGGASEGIRQALGVGPTVAINHCPHAIRMHAANHPETEHYTESVFDVAPLAAARGRAVDLLWASPSCTHFSRARGGTPVTEQLRSHGWIVVDWARDVRPRVIVCENVEEWRTWGPLDGDGQPIKAQAGETWRAFLAALGALGYRVEHRVLCAADYGAPTTRRRLFLVARCDGAPIVWPEPSHGVGHAHPWRTAAECIDWSIPCPSIFERARPLAEATQRRIAEGIRRFVLNNPRPFLVNLTHGARVESVDEPAKTVTGANRGEKAVAVPYIVPNNTNNLPRAITEPVPVVTTGPRNLLVAPSLIRTDMQSDGHLRGLSAVNEPLRTVTTGGGVALVAPALVNTRNGERAGQAPRVHDPAAPWGTVTAIGSQGALVAAFLAKHYGGVVGHGVDRTLGTVTGVDHHSLAAVFLDKLHGSARAGQGVDAPAPAVLAGGGRGGGHAALVAAFLLKFYQQGGQWSACDEPLHTATAKARMGLVTVDIAGEEYVLVDIGMRMLQPRELARAQGFDDAYHLIGTKSEQVARLGNSVCPPVARAIVAANLNTQAEAVAK